jgi:hypothetical protein
MRDTRFSLRCFEGWDHTVINDASGLHHFTWHMNTRMNWGEPWGEAMRTGQVEYRIKNQDFFRRNLFPRMLGWFLIRLADKSLNAPRSRTSNGRCPKPQGLTRATRCLSRCRRCICTGA